MVPSKYRSSLLVQLLIIPSWIAALGAVITIMASLTGFFTQQLVEFDDCLQKDLLATAGVWKTNNYTAAGGMIGPVSNDAFPPMVAAINVGTYVHL